MNSAIVLSLGLSLILTILAWGGTLFRFLIHRRLDMVDWFVGAIGAFNGVGFVFIIWATYAGLNPFWEMYFLSHSYHLYLFPFSSFIVVFGSWIGRVLGLTLIKSRNTSPKKDLLRQYSRVKLLAWFFFLFGVVSYWLYARAYGGFNGLLNWSIAIRSGVFDIVPSNSWSFLRPFGGFSFLSSFLFYALFLEKRRLQRKIEVRTVLGLVLSIIFSSYVLYSWRGRVMFIVYFAVFILSRFHVPNFRFKVTNFLKLSTIIILLFLALPILSAWITPGKSLFSITEFYAKEVSFPAISYLQAIENPVFRWGKDVVCSPLYLLPERIWYPIVEETASDINTKNILGSRKGEGNVTGGIPTDFITFSYMELGVVGIMLLSIIWGIFLIWFDKQILRSFPNTLYSVMYFYSALNISVLTALYADPHHFIKRNFSFLIGLIITTYVLAKNKTASKKYKLFSSGLVDQNTIHTGEVSGERERKASSFCYYRS